MEIFYTIDIERNSFCRICGKIKEIKNIIKNLAHRFEVKIVHSKKLKMYNQCFDINSIIEDTASS